MDSTPTKQSSISDLNEICVQRLESSYLNVSEKFRLILADQRFLRILEGSLKDRIVDTTHIQENFEINEAHEILSKWGRLIERIRLEAAMNDLQLDYHRLLLTHCPNLKEIDLYGLEITASNVYGQLLQISKHAHTVRLRKCIVSNDACLILSKLLRLEMLDLQHSKLSGNHLHKLQNLHHLNLRNCRSFKSKNFIQICKTTKLKSLNIAHCKQLSNAAFKTLLETQFDLDHVTVGNRYWSKDYQKICYLKNLREFSMRYCEERQVAGYLKELTHEHRKTLRSIDIHFSCDYPCETAKFLQLEICDRIAKFKMLKILCLPYCSLLENTNLIRLTKACPELEMIDIRGSTFTDNGIVGCVENLNQLKFLDISYCNVERTLYHILVEIRLEKGCNEPLTVYVKDKTTMAGWLTTEFHEERKNFVLLSLDQMRLPEEAHLMERLKSLKESVAKLEFAAVCPDVNSNESNSIRIPSLTSLDDDCLYHILSYLNLIQRLTLVLSSHRFDDIFRHFLQTDLFKMPDVLTNFTVREVRKILKRFGSAIQRLSLEPAHNHFDIEYHRLAAKYCTNLVEFNCKSVELETARQIISAAHDIHTLKLTNCELDDDMLRQIAELQNLEMLSLENSNATGNHLWKLGNLVELNLGNCRQFQSKYFAAVCETNRLKSLDIRGCESLDDDAFEKLIETQTRLEHVTVGKVYKARNFEIVAQLTNLSDIKLRKCHFDHMLRYLNSLIEHRRERLTFLEIDYLTNYPKFEYSSTLTDGIVRTVRENLLEFKNLRYLRLPENTIIDNEYIQRLSRACPLIEILDLRTSDHLSDDGIASALKLLKNLRHFDITSCKVTDTFSLYYGILKIMKERNTGPLTLYSRYDTIMRAFLNTKEYENTKKYVVISDSCIRQLDLVKYFKTKSNHDRKVTLPVFESNSCHKQLSILDLPDKCLSRLISYLDTINRLKLIILDNRFYPLIEPFIENIIFDLNDVSCNFTLSETQELFARCSKQLKRIRFRNYKPNKPFEYLKLIEPYSRQLIEIEIDSLSDEIFEQILGYFASSKLLEVAKFNNCFPTDFRLQELAGNTQLRILNVSGSCVSGQYINQFANLIELSLEYCFYVETKYFIEICRNCKLKSLDIRQCNGLQNKAFEALIDTQTDLERLYISTEYSASNFAIISQLKNLKYLTIDYDATAVRIEEILDRLVQDRRDDLLTLELQNNVRLNIDYDFTEVVRKRVEKFRKLQSVEIYQPEVYVRPCFWL